MMQMQAARLAYAQPEGPVRTARGLEYDLIARTTQRLSAAWDKRSENYPAFVAALEANNRLWSTFARDVADPGNTLPAPLRAQLFYLFQFTAEHSRAILDNGGQVAVLVDINTAIMRGLRGEEGGS